MARIKIRGIKGITPRGFKMHKVNVNKIIFKRMDRKATTKKLRNFVWFIAGIILMAVMVASTTVISDNRVFTTGDVIATNLNVTGDFITNNLNVSGDVRILGKLTGASPISIGHEGVLFRNQSNEIHYSIYHATENLSQSFINVTNDFDRTMIFQSDDIKNANGINVCFWDKNKQKMLFCINDIQSRATTVKNSFQIVADNKLDDNNFTLCSNTNFIDCDSAATGADLFVEDDIEAQSIFANENFESTNNVIVGNQIQIKGGNPAANRVLTSDANGLATWVLSSGGGWTDAGATIILTNINDDVGIGEAGPDSKLHVADGGTAGAVTPFAGTIATFESPGAGYLSILTPNANERGIFFGEPTSNIAGGIIYNSAGALDGFQFRTNGNNTRMTIGSAGDLSFPSDLDLTTGTGGVFKFVDNAFQAGLDGSNYLEVGHGGSNSFLNQVGAGGMDFRFGGTTKATFTPAGHLHLMTDTDQKHTLKIITANNLQDTGIAWENSGGSFTHTIFRTDVGSNRADLVFAVGINSNIDLLTNSFRIHGEASDEGNVEFFQDVGIGTSSPNAKLEVNGTPGASVGGFPSGQFHVTSPSTSVNGNAVITGHNSFSGNTQLWYLGSTSSSNQNIALINRQNAELHLHTNNLNSFSIEADGDVIIERGNLTLQDKITFRLAETIDNIVNGWIRITGNLNVTGNIETTGNITVDTVIDNTIFAQLSSSVDQIPINTTAAVITYDTQDAINRINHSTTVNPGEITIDTAGVYFVSPQPQVGKDTGGVKVDFDMFLQVDRGAGFINEPNSNIKLTIKDSDITDVIVSAFTISLNSGDKIRMMQKTSSSGVGMGLKNTNSTAEIPRTPSIIFTMYRIGG